MKRFLLSAFALLLTTAAFAQNSNVVLFSEGGERFFVILNGQRMNADAVTNLKVEDLNQPAYKLKVIFEDKNHGEMQKNLYLQPGDETVFNVKRNKKGQWKLAIQSTTPIAQAPPAPAVQQIVHWGAPTPAPAPRPVATGGTVIVEETTTTTTTGGTSMGTNVNTGTGENVSMNVNVDGFGMNVNINTNETVGTTDVHHTTTTTTTTTTMGGGEVFQEEVYEEPPCNMMEYDNFSGAKASIKKKSFSDSKMTLAKQITRNHCLSADQVREITELFDFESDRLEYAKFAWAFCFEQNAYYKVNDAFEFESSIDDLDAYIGGR